LFANKRFRRSRMRWRRTIFCFRNRPNRALSPFRFDMRLPSTRQCLKQVAGMLGYPSHSRATKRPSAPYAPPHGRRTLRRAKVTLGGCSESQGFSGGDVRACGGRQEGAPAQPRGARADRHAGTTRGINGQTPVVHRTGQRSSASMNAAASAVILPLA
jgi:hypothetical protein